MGFCNVLQLGCEVLQHPVPWHNQASWICTAGLILPAVHHPCVLSPTQRGQAAHEDVQVPAAGLCLWLHSTAWAVVAMLQALLV